MNWIGTLSDTSLKRLCREVSELEADAEAKRPGTPAYHQIQLRLAAHHAFHTLQLLGREIEIVDLLGRGGRQDGETKG
jgi:hypothetical protein